MNKLFLSQGTHWMKEVDLGNKGFLTFEEFKKAVETNQVNTHQYIKLKKGDGNVQLLGLDKFKSVVTKDSELECISEQKKSDCLE